MRTVSVHLVAAGLLCAAVVPAAGGRLLPSPGETRTLTPAGAVWTEPDFSPDGNSLAVVRGNELLVVSGVTEDAQTERVIATGPISGPDWSPDGLRIAFARPSASGLTDFDLYVVGADGTGEQRIFFAGGGSWFAANPSWSPDGARIAFEGLLPSSGSSDASIWTITPNGGNLTPLVGGGALGMSAGSPAWSRDGTRVAYVRYPTSCSLPCNDSLRVLRVDGSSDVELSSGYVHDAPTWTPGDTAIAFERASLGDPRPSIVSIALAGSGSAGSLGATATVGYGLPDWSSRDAVAYVEWTWMGTTLLSQRVLVHSGQRPTPTDPKVTPTPDGAQLLLTLPSSQDPVWPIDAYWELGPTTAYGQPTAPQRFEYSGSPGPPRVFTTTVTGLLPLTTYHARFIVTNVHGTRRGPDLQFTTTFSGGVWINAGAEATRSPRLVLDLVGPPQATHVVVSDDPGFAGARTFPIASTIAWPAPAPKGKNGKPVGTFYAEVWVRFLGPGLPETLDFHDKIRVDRQPPRLGRVTVRRLPRTRAGGPPRYELVPQLVSRDLLDRAQVTADRKRPGPWLSLGGTLAYATRARIVWMRVRDVVRLVSNWQQVVLAAPSRPAGRRSERGLLSRSYSDASAAAPAPRPRTR